MSETEFKEMFARNLSYYVSQSGHSQSEIAKTLHISKATFSSWCIGTRTPRMDKVDMLCDYFGIRRSDLMEPRSFSATTVPSPLRLSSQEEKVILAYRSSSPVIQNVVHDVLHVSGEDTQDSGLSSDAV